MKPLVLTSGDLARIPSHLAPIQKGAKVRMGCPFHGSDKQRSLEVSPEGFWRCYVCQEWGVTEERDRQFREDTNRQAYKSTNLHKGLSIPRLNLTKATCEPLPEESLQVLRGWQQGLSEVDQYLQSRAIPLGLAAHYGLAFKPKGDALWIDEGKKKWWDARLIAPHTNPQGQVVSLYSRAIDPNTEKQFRHAHLPLPKGHFNSPAFLADGEPLYICEGVFDALSLLAVGFDRVVAVFGLGGFRWDWVQPHEKEIILALDQDSAGQKAIPTFLDQATQRGIRVARVTADEIGGAKDINEALVMGSLFLRGAKAPDSPPARDAEHKGNPPPRFPDIPPEGLPADRWLSFVALAKQTPMPEGYSEQDIYSLPTTRTGSDAGILWQAAGITHDRLTFLPDRVVIERESEPLVIRRVNLKPSGWMP